MTAVTRESSAPLVTAQDGGSAALLGTVGAEALVTSDGGRVWTPVRRVAEVSPGAVDTDREILVGRGLSDDQTHALDVIDPVAGTIAAVAVAEQFRQPNSGMLVRGSLVTAALDGRASVSTDAGATWHAVPRVVDGLGGRVASAPDGDLVAASGADGAGWIPLRHVYRSRDGGATWTTTAIAARPAVAMDTLVPLADGGYLASSTSGAPLSAGPDLVFRPQDVGGDPVIARLQTNNAGIWATSDKGGVQLVRDTGQWSALRLPE